MSIYFIRSAVAFGSALSAVLDDPTAANFATLHAAEAVAKADAILAVLAETA